jgi:ABC-type lipoprotein release transport system permease subunit
MLIFIRLAIRNLFRNKRRAFIAGSAIGIGLASLIFVDALVIGMERNMIASATESFMGEGQIHRESFRESFAVEKTIADLENLTGRLAGDTLVENFSRRVMSFAMISSPANLSAINMVGIDPDEEKDLSQIDEAIIEGEYLTGESLRQIVIGSKLAEILEVELGDRVVITVSQAYTGDLAQEMFRISGIYKLNIKEMDRAMAFIHLSRSQQMLGLGSEVHEIALKFKDSEPGRNKQHAFWEEFSGNGNDAIGWTAILPELEAALELSQFSTFFLGVILFGVVALGIVNTLFMSIHERMFEFGVLRAVGTRAAAMARLVLLEAGALAIFSSLIGAVLGFLITYMFVHIGIDYTGIEFSGVTFRKLLYPVLEVGQFIKYPIAVYIFTVFTALYPAIYAARLTPSEAMRRSF